MSKLTDGTLTPAYGRDYKSAAAAIKDFEGGKDFQYHKGVDTGYVGKSDFADGAKVKIRYNRITDAVMHTVKHG